MKENDPKSLKFGFFSFWSNKGPQTLLSVRDCKRISVANSSNRPDEKNMKVLARTGHFREKLSKIKGRFLSKNRRKSDEILNSGPSNLEKRILDEILALETSFCSLWSPVYKKTRFFSQKSSFYIENGKDFLKFSAIF